MKTFLMILSLLSISMPALASGYLSYQQNYFTTQHSFRPEVSLDMDQALLGPYLYYSSATGYFNTPFNNSPTDQYVLSSHDLNFSVSAKVTISLGGAIGYDWPANEYINNVHARLAYQLW